MIPAPPPGAASGFPPPRPDLAPEARPPERPTVTWRWFEAIAIYVLGYFVVGTLVGAGLVLAIVGVDDVDEITGTTEVVLTIAVNATFVAFMIGWLSWRHPGWVRAIGLPQRGRRLRDAVYGGVMGVLLYPAIAIVIGLPMSFLLEAISGEPSTTPEQLPAGLTSGGKVLAVFLAVVAAPLMEEFFYRGVLYRSIRDRHGFWAGALLSAILFGLVHYVAAPWQDTVLLQSVMVFTGFAFAWIYERKGTIVAPIAAHVVFNVIGITLILSGAA